jgi:hypothetical protein
VSLANNCSLQVDPVPFVPNGLLQAKENQTKSPPIDFPPKAFQHQHIFRIAPRKYRVIKADKKIIITPINHPELNRQHEPKEVLLDLAWGENTQRDRNLGQEKSRKLLIPSIKLVKHHVPLSDRPRVLIKVHWTLRILRRKTSITHSQTQSNVLKHKEIKINRKGTHRWTQLHPQKQQNFNQQETSLHCPTVENPP